jgi:hypothetical protein
MRPLPAALAISAIFHVAVLAWLSERPQPRPVPVRAPTATNDAPREPELTEVVLLDDHDSVASGIRPQASDVRRPGSTKQALVLRDTKQALVLHGQPGHEPVEPPKHSPLMTMRQPEITHGPSQSWVDEFLAHSKPLAPADSEHERIANALAEDRKLDDPNWVEHASPDAVAAARFAREEHRAQRDAEELKPAGNGTYQSHHGAFDATVARDGTVNLHDKPSVELSPGCIFAGCPMNLDDAMMRAAGIDPYRAAKLHWLDKTREERFQIGLANRKTELAHSAQAMQRNLTWMWNKTRDPVERKQALFELWDEVAESGDDDLVRGGEAARRYLVGFVRSKLPEGSAGAFTGDELAQLNAHRRSHEPFAPY